MLHLVLPIGRVRGGGQVVTAASPGPSVFPKDSPIDMINADWIRDPKLLFAIHRARVDASGRAGHARVLPQPGDEMGFRSGSFARR